MDTTMKHQTEGDQRVPKSVAEGMDKVEEDEALLREFSDVGSHQGEEDFVMWLAEA